MLANINAVVNFLELGDPAECGYSADALHQDPGKGDLGDRRVNWRGADEFVAAKIDHRHAACTACTCFADLYAHSVAVERGVLQRKCIGESVAVGDDGRRSVLDAAAVAGVDPCAIFHVNAVPQAVAAEQP